MKNYNKFTLEFGILYHKGIRKFQSKKKIYKNVKFGKFFIVNPKQNWYKLCKNNEIKTRSKNGNFY